jgi:hypothetical protein
MHDRQASLPTSAFTGTVFAEATMVKLHSTSDRKEHKRSGSRSTIREKETPKLQLVTKALTMPFAPFSQSTTNLTPAQTPVDEDVPPAVPPKEPKLAPLNVQKAPSTPAACTAPQRNRAGSEPQTNRPARLHKRQASAQDHHPTSRVRLEAAPITTTSSGQVKRRSTAYKAIPRGMRPLDVPKTLQAPVVDSLQRAARRTCEKFAVLSPSEVDSLTQELAQLESRCEYLKKTHASLRSGKKALHMKMLQHLRSDRSSAFSRETLLKQQEALADLDNSIDDWEAKMERVRQLKASRLHQHR